MKTYEYNDGLRSGGRRPRLYLAKGGQVKKFTGENIPGVAAVAAKQFQKAGKWSNTTYQLTLAAGVRPLYFLSPLHGVWGDNLTSWGEVASHLQLPVEVAQQLVRGEYPRTAERLDKLEAFGLAQEEQGCDTEIVVVSFGGPTRRAMAEGYWSTPKTSRASDGREVKIGPGPGQGSQGWYAPVALAPKGARVVGARHQPGTKGGYFTIEVAVPLGGEDDASPEASLEVVEDKPEAEEEVSTPPPQEVAAPAQAINPNSPFAALAGLKVRKD